MESRAAMERVLCTFCAFLLLTLRSTTEAICPSGCVCDDVSLRVECVGGDLDIVPITLNPQLRSLVLQNNRIRSAAVDESFNFYTELQELDLSRNFLSSLESGTLQHQTNLARLDVSHNRISVIENRTFQGLHNLKYLLFSDNLLETLDAGPFADLTQLKVLDVSSNRIKSLHPKALRGLRNLERLNLQNNFLTSVPAHALRHAESLQFLTLSGNSLREIHPKTFKGVHTLKHLELDNCEIYKFSDQAFQGSSELEYFSMQDNWISEVPTVSLIPLRHLKALALAGNPIREILPSSFTPLASLRALDLSRCGQLAKLWPDALNGLAQLTHLNFSYDTGLQAFESGSLVGADGVMSLDLSYSGVQAVSISAATDWESVVEINVTGCPLQCNCQNSWLITWLRRRNESASGAECYFPEQLRGQSFVSVDEASFGCDSYVTAKVLMGLGCGLAIVVVAIFAFVIHHYRGSLHSVFKNGLGKSGGEGGGKEKDCCESSRRLENEYIIYAVPGGIRAVPITEL